MAKATANTSAAGDCFDGKHDGKSTNEAELAEQKEKWEDADFLSFEGTEDKKEESTDQTTPRKTANDNAEIRISLFVIILLRRLLLI